MQFPVVRCCRSHPTTLNSRVRRGRKSRIRCWNFDAVCRSCRDINISGFGGNIAFSAVSGCAGNTFFDLPVRLWSKTQLCRWNFDDKFQRQTYIFGDINTSGLGGHITISGWGRCRNHSHNVFYLNVLGFFTPEQ